MVAMVRSGDTASQPSETTVADQTLRAGLRQPDYQARRLYNAEKRFIESPPAGHERFADIREARRWLQALSASTELSDAYPHASGWLADHPVTVKRSTAKRMIGCVESGTANMRLSSYDDGAGMVLPVVIHEFAHIVHGASPAERFQQSHGPEFAAVYVDLVAVVCGDAEAGHLRRDFADNEVDVDDAARRVTISGAGLLASRGLPRPTRRRTPESVAVARDALFAAAAEKQAAKILTHREMGTIVRHNRMYFEKALDAGAVLPAKILAALTSDAPQRSRLPSSPPAAQTTRQRRRRRPARRLCDKVMPRARRRCGRKAGHRGHCA